MTAHAHFNFSASKVIVTGGSQGIGKGIAMRFAQAGAEVSICARREKYLTAAQDEIGALTKVHAAICDLRDPQQIENYVADAAAALGGIDVVVNNASGIGRSDDEEGWASSLELDIMGNVRMGKAAMPWLEKSTTAAIVYINSITAFRGSVKASPYAAVKAAMLNYTKSQALALIPKGIRVNAVAPGSTEAPGHFFEKRRLSGDPGYAATLATQPTGRMGTPEDIADVVLFLCSDAARWIYGQTIIADGGQLMNGG